MNIAFIPARCGSKSIPFKNIKEFCGKPLVYWNIKALQDSKNIDKIYLATDCEEIGSVVRNFNFSKVEIYDRDIKNANDTASTESVMLEFINKNNFNENDLFLLVQGTSPLTETKDFNKAIEQYKNSNYDSLLTCTRDKKFFWSDDNQPINYDYKNRPRRQEFNGLLVENGAFYINKIKNIKKYQNRLCLNIGIYEMEEFKSIDIDYEDDWLIAENLMYKYIIKKK